MLATKSRSQLICVRKDRDQSTTKTKQRIQIFGGGMSNDANWQDLRCHFR